MDCGATFQFVADDLAPARSLIAPDWRGFGRSGWNPQGYWFPDYFADLDAMLDWLSPGTPVDIVGHSMGGNVAMIYAGLRPERVQRLVTLEGFGLPGAPPELAPGRYRDWLDQWREPEPASVFPSLEVFAGVLRKRNPRLSADRADFVARAWSEVLPDGRVRPRFDPAHKRVNPDPVPARGSRGLLGRGARAAAVRRGRRVGFPRAAAGRWRPRTKCAGWCRNSSRGSCAAAGHMVHHDQPAAVARLVEEFLDRQAL